MPDRADNAASPLPPPLSMLWAPPVSVDAEDRVVQARSQTAIGGETNAGETEDEGYIPVYYPGTTDAQSATSHQSAFRRRVQRRGSHAYSSAPCEFAAR